MVEIMIDRAAGPGLSTVIRMHRRRPRRLVPRGYVAALRSGLRSSDMRRNRADLSMPNGRPGAAGRLQAIATGMEWDAAAYTGRMRSQSYADSPEAVDHRSGRNVPTAKNGSNERQR